MRIAVELDQCCWSCVSCRDDAYVFNDSCLSCKPGWAPNANKTDCYKLKAEVIPWFSPWAIVPLVFSTIGILMTLFTFCVFIKYNNTPIIMASGRELCYVSRKHFVMSGRVSRPFPDSHHPPPPHERKEGRSLKVKTMLNRSMGNQSISVRNDA
ncbi:hypothetical protein RUM44_006472 [Polyplax serrata]|uniref:G-protein coupled receptors family 3 profile domain-containing protein n=1 Tax=Polyplax serrata TaxID=468196 RepID=A0ABR1AI70_POLSC